MAGAKQTYNIGLDTDQIAFIKSVIEKYDIPDESKVVRIMADYLMTQRDVLDTVFGETRCLWCE